MAIHADKIIEGGCFWMRQDGVIAFELVMVVVVV